MENVYYGADKQVSFRDAKHVCFCAVLLNLDVGKPIIT